MLKDQTKIMVNQAHTSDRIAFKRCRRKWALGSYMLHNLTPDRINDKLWLGTGVHEALAQHYDKGLDLLEVFNNWAAVRIEEIKAIGTLWVEQEQLISEAVALGLGMLDHYSEWSKNEDPLWFKEVISVEHEFEVPIVNELGEPLINPNTGEVMTYTGRIDGVVKDEYGCYWLLEHKTAKAFDTEKLPLDEQCGSYIWAAQQLYGLKLEGVIYNMLRKKLPTVPDILKRGGLSQNKGMDTTYQVYAQALKQYYGEDAVPWALYEDYLTALENKENPFFKRLRVRRNQCEITDIGQRIYDEVAEMVNPNLVHYPNPTRDCSWDCDFRSVCLAMNDGSDPQYMLESLFKKRTAPSKGIVVED